MVILTAKSYPVQRHVPATVNMEVPPPPGLIHVLVLNFQQQINACFDFCEVYK